MQGSRTRLAAGLAATAAVAAGLAVRHLAAGPIAKYGGVALWAALVYALVVFVRPAASIGRAAATALLISVVVEFAQLTPVPRWLASQHVVLRLIFGTTFNAPDLLAYAAGVAIGAGLHAMALRTSADPAV